MKKGIVVYKGKYGATRQYAEWLGAELALPVQPAEKLTREKLSSFDYLVIGSSVYIGKLLMGKWLRKNLALLTGKTLFLFIVCATPDSDPTTQAGIIKRNVPASLLGQLSISFSARKARQTQTLLEGCPATQTWWLAGKGSRQKKGNVKRYRWSKNGEFIKNDRAGQEIYFWFKSMI